jgi:hypothetical protein
MTHRFDTAEDIDAFVDALNYMLVEFAQAYKNDDASFDSIADSIEVNVSHLAALAKDGMETTGR